MNQKRNILNNSQAFLNMQRQDFAISYMFVGIVHILYTIVFYCANISIMTYYNIFASIFYLILSILVSKKGNVLICVMLCFVEILSFSTIGILFLGYKVGFSLYLVTLIPLVMYIFFLLDNKKKMFFRRLIIVMFMYFISTALSLIDIFQIENLSIFYEKTIFLLNGVFSFFLLGFFFYIFLYQMDDKEGSLKKENEMLKNIANYDPLTKLLNRRPFDYYFEKHLKNVQTKGKDFCVLIADIDDFKKVNDTYGHDVGDDVLIGIANIIKEYTKGKGQAFRWGGEEFLFLLSLSEKDALEFANQLCEKIGTYSFEFGNVTVSIGITSYQQMETEDSMIKKADNALYFGKKNGKNQANIYGKCLSK